MSCVDIICTRAKFGPISGMEPYEPDSSELEVSTTAGDGAEDLVFGKGEGGPREGAKDAGPREGIIAAGLRGKGKFYFVEIPFMMMLL